MTRTPPPADARVVLADDHVLFRQGLRALLQQAGFLVVGEASDGRAAVRLCACEQPAFAILDCAMPLLNGVDAAREIRRESPGTRVVLLTMYGEGEYVLAGLRAGACGYVLKSAAAEDLLCALGAAGRGEVYLSPSVSRTVVDAYLSGAPLPPDPLSGREREVLQLIAEGRGMKEIGELLGISARTAETHRARIMAKLEVHDLAGLVKYALKHGLSSDEPIR